jgi:hypothetical protein
MALTKKTVLILGAGASMPYGFPSGDELKMHIISQLENYPTLVGPATQLEHLTREANIEDYHVKNFRDELAGASHVTIDRFLENRPEFGAIGKLAIAATLIPFERSSIISMFIPSKVKDQKRIAEGWYKYFAQQLRLSSTYWGDGLLTIITYNYDRSLEYFLFRILTSTCKKSQQECWDIFQTIPIIHIYGELGAFNPIDDGLPYAPSLNIETARAAAKNIRLMHEAKNEGLTNRSKTAVENAEVVCFLGFGYHPENIEPLAVKARTQGKRVLGTAYQLTKAERSRLKLGHYVDEPLDCRILELLKETDVLG